MVQVMVEFITNLAIVKIQWFDFGFLNQLVQGPVDTGQAQLFIAGIPVDPFHDFGSRRMIELLKGFKNVAGRFGKTRCRRKCGHNYKNENHLIFKKDNTYSPEFNRGNKSSLDTRWVVI